MKIYNAEFFAIGGRWEIHLAGNIIGDFIVRSIDERGNVIGVLLSPTTADGRSLAKGLGALEAALREFSFAVAHEEETRLAKRGLSIQQENLTFRLGLEFEGLVVLFDEARFSFQLIGQKFGQKAG